MKAIIFLCLFIGIILGAPGKNNPTFEEFEEEFNHIFADPEKEKAAEDELAKEEEQIDQQNELFEKGEANFDEQLQPWDDYTEDEFATTKEGLLPGKADETGRSSYYDFTKYHMGRLETPEHEKVNTPEELAFLDNLYRNYDRADLPASWDSRSKGWISSVKSQGNCGSCVAFATNGMAEAALIKAGATKSGLDLSEQWLVDCKPIGALGCCGAHVASYTKFLKQGNLMHENAFPYKAFYHNDTSKCPSGPYWSPGYKIDKTIFDWKCNEAKLMKQIMEFGASLISVYASDLGFKNYKSGVFDKCSPKQTDHQVLAVGWGTENGIPYWLIKNSWGTGYGDNGYVKVKRGTCHTDDEECGFITAVKTTGVAGNVPAAPPPPPFKGCDLSSLFGKMTGLYTLTWTGAPVHVTCIKGKCSADGAKTVKESCIAICGQSPCF